MMNRLNYLVAVIAGLVSTALAGCAATGADGGAPVLIQVEREGASSAGDCPVSVKLFNRMRVAWSGVSFHVVLRSTTKAPVGELRGISHRYTEPGYGIIVPARVNGARCEDIAMVSVLYFGYYPADGGGQIRLSNAAVAAEVK